MLSGRTCEAMKEAGIDDPYNIEAVRNLGVIDLPTIQKKLNLHYTLSLDLFGSEVSTNAANAFSAGVKGRYRETRIDDDHKLLNDTYPVTKLVDGKFVEEDVPALSALNMRLRNDYAREASGGVVRWNAIIKKVGVNFDLKMPHQAFHRQIGEFANINTTPDGIVISDEQWEAKKHEWLPTSSDGDFIKSLMIPVTEPGKYAGWIAPPKLGIDNKPGDFEYVQLHQS